MCVCVCVFLGMHAIVMGRRLCLSPEYLTLRRMCGLQGKPVLKLKIFSCPRVFTFRLGLKGKVDATLQIKVVDVLYSLGKPGVR